MASTLRPWPLAGAVRRWNAPVYAIPIDVFRVLTGCVALAYFVRMFLDARDFTGPDGLIDHALSGTIFPFTRLGLFNSSMSLPVFQTVFAIAILASIGLIAGYRPKWWSAVLYIIAVSAYRWNFLVIYVDDAIVHLMLFWMLLLPIGRTLVLHEWMAGGADTWSRWKRVTVSGLAVRCFVGNVLLIYLVAGLWKWSSPMWREGTAVYAILKTPLSYAPDWWGTGHLTFLTLMNYLALFFEPLFPMVLLLHAGRSLARYAFLAAFVGFHGFIIATMRVPFANLACLAAAVVLARDDLMFLLRQKPPSEFPAANRKVEGTGVFAIGLVGILSLAMLTSVSLSNWRRPDPRSAGHAGTADRAPDRRASFVDGLEQPQQVFFSALWAVGLAQQYQLLNWIDDRNFKFIYAIEEVDSHGNRKPVAAHWMFPDNLRSVLLQSNLHGTVWIGVPANYRASLRRSLRTRFAARYCRLFRPSGSLRVKAYVKRTGVMDSRAEALPTFDMTFTCDAGTPRFHH